MRSSHFFTLAVTLSLVLLAGCNLGRKGKGDTNFTKGGPGGIGEGDGIAITIDGETYPDQIPFDTRTDLSPVSDAEAGLEVVYFGFDSSSLPPAEISKIDRAGAYLKANPSHVMIIEGHCDERGSNEYNLSLGEYRAQAVRTYLTNLGIAGSRLQTRSYGEEKPAVIGSGEPVWAQNRRAVFAVFAPNK